MSLGMMLNLPQSRSASTAATMVPSPAGGCQESSWVSTGDGRDVWKGQSSKHMGFLAATSTQGPTKGSQIHAGTKRRDDAV